MEIENSHSRTRSLVGNVVEVMTINQLEEEIQTYLDLGLREDHPLLQEHRDRLNYLKTLELITGDSL